MKLYHFTTSSCVATALRHGFTPTPSEPPLLFWESPKALAEENHPFRLTIEIELERENILEKTPTPQGASYQLKNGSEITSEEITLTEKRSHQGKYIRLGLLELTQLLKANPNTISIDENPLPSQNL